MSDLCFHGHFRDESSCYCRPESYASPIFSNMKTFSVEEYKVFQVKRKFMSENGKWDDKRDNRRGCKRGNGPNRIE